MRWKENYENDGKDSEKKVARCRNLLLPHAYTPTRLHKMEEYSAEQIENWLIALKKRQNLVAVKFE